MPKLKTRKCAAKRLQADRNRQVPAPQGGRRHLKSSKNAKRRRRLRQDGAVKSTEMSRIKAALPYGL